MADQEDRILPTHPTFRYDLFISYHRNDVELARQLQAILQTIAKPWYKRRSLRVFLDRTDIPATSSLPGYIADAIRHSGYFLLLASPSSAESQWVRQEVALWLASRPISNLFVWRTSGQLVWDFNAAQFDEKRTDCLPPELLRAFSTQPGWLPSSKDGVPAEELRTEAARIAAPIKGLDLRDLETKDARIHKRNLLTAYAAAILLISAITALAFTWHRAMESKATIVTQQKRLSEERHNTRSAKLAEEMAGYQTDIAQADGLYLQKDLARARTLLDRAYPDLRSWEWHFLDSRLDQSTTLDIFKDPPTCVDIKPNGREVAVCLSDGRVELLSLPQLTLRYLQGSQSVPIDDLKYSTDGGSLLAVYHNGRTVNWNLESDTSPSLSLNELPLRAPRHTEDHNSRLSIAAISPRSDMIAYFDSDKEQLRLYTGGSSAATAETGSSVIALAFTPDGKQIFAATFSGEVTLYNTRPLKLIATMHFPFKITSIAATVSPSTVAVGGDTGSVLVDLAHRHTLVHLDTNYEVIFVKTDPEGYILVTGSSDGILRLWTHNGVFLRELRGHRGSPRSAVFDTSEATLYSVGDALRQWKPQERDELTVRTLPATEGHIALSAGGDLAAFWPSKNGITILDVVRGVVLTTLPTGRGVARLAFIQDGKKLWVQSGSANRNAATFQAGENHFELWDISQRRLVRAFNVGGPRLTGAVLSKDGRYIIADQYSADEHSLEKDRFSEFDFISIGQPGGGARADKSVMIIDSLSGKLLSRAECDDHNLVVADCDSSGQWCATGHAYRGFRAMVGAPFRSFGAVDIVERKTNTSIRLFHPEGVRSIAFNPDGTMLAVAGDSGTVELIHLSGFKAVNGLLSSQRSSLAQKQYPDFGFSPLGSVMEDTSISRAIDRRTIDLHTLPVNEVVFTADGSRVITGSVDGSIKFGGIDGHDYATAFANASPVLDIAWSRTGDRLVALTADGQLNSWEVKRGNLIEEAQTLVSEANELSQTGECAEALSAYDSAVARYQSYLSGRSEVQIQLQFAGLLMDRGIAQAKCSHFKEAEADFAYAVSLCEQNEHSAISAQWEHQLRATLLNRADMRADHGEKAAARDDLDRVTKNVQEVSRVEGETDSLVVDITHAYSVEAMLSLRENNTGHAIEELSKAISVLKKNEEPANPEIWISLERALNNRASAYAERGDKSHALKDLDQSITLTTRLVDLGVLGAKQDMNSSIELRNKISKEMR